MGIGNAFPFLHLMPVFAASESGVLRGVPVSLLSPSPGLYLPGGSSTND